MSHIPKLAENQPFMIKQTSLQKIYMLHLNKLLLEVQANQIESQSLYP